MRDYTDEKYIELIEKTKDPVLRRFMETEVREIENVKEAYQKTFVDLGAGHGRVLPHLAKRGHNVISIELNPGMLIELRKRSSLFQNSTVIQGDFTKLSQLLEDQHVQKPVLLLLQNTLGTIEGVWKKVLSEIRKVAKERDGEVILSLFRKAALPTYGIKLYNSIQEMTGAPDVGKTDFTKGKFVSKTGYTSKWRSDDEIQEIKQYFGGTVLNEIWEEEFYILHTTY